MEILVSAKNYDKYKQSKIFIVPKVDNWFIF